jgi:hypothetical protein
MVAVTVLSFALLHSRGMTSATVGRGNERVAVSPTVVRGGVGLNFTRVSEK